MTKPVNGSRFRRLKRILGRCLVFVSAVFFLCIIFIGEILEFAVHKYDQKYLGREVEIGDLDVNILFGTLTVDRLKIYEQHGTDRFVDVKGIFADMKPWPFIKQSFVLEEVGIDQLTISIAHTNSEFNYDDLLDRFLDSETNESDTAIATASWYWDAQDIHVDSCRIEYHNRVLDTRITAYPFNLNIPRIAQDLDTFSLHTDVGFAQGGRINVDGIVNFAKESYSFDANLHEVGIKYLFHYLRDYLAISNLEGRVNVDLDAEGEIRDLRNVTLVGNISLDDLSIQDNDADTVLALGSGAIVINEANYKTSTYDFGTIRFVEPFLNFELYPDGDNLSSLVTFEIESEDSLQVEDFNLPGREYFNVFVYLADYARLVVQEYNDSDYKIDSIVVHRGRIHYSDYTLNDDVNFILDSIELEALEFNTEKSRTTFKLSSKINQVGSFESVWTFDPRDVLEMDLEITTHNFLLNSVSPYSTYHTGYPFNHGDVLYEGHVRIHNRMIESQNRLFIEDIEVGRKGFADPPVKLPVRLAVSILRDLDGNVDLELPVEGDLDDPKFKYWSAVFQVLKTLMVKVATAPYRLFAGMFSVDADDLKEMPWVYGQYKIEKEQRKRATSLRKVLEGKPDLSLTYQPVNNAEKEKDYLAIFESKSAYYQDLILQQSGATLTAEDTAAIGRIPSQDSAFVEYLKLASGSEGLRSVAEMSRAFIGESKLAAEYRQRQEIRDSIFRNLIIEENAIAPERLKRIFSDSVASAQDTFNLAGPKYILGFDLIEE